MAKWDHDDLRDRSQDPIERAYAGDEPKVAPRKPINYKYDEGKHLKELQDYIDSTYSAHYASKNDIQALDVFKALGSLFTTSRDLAIKYLWRAGKKGNKEDLKKDLLKVIHYCFFMLHAMETEKIDDK